MTSLLNKFIFAIFLFLMFGCEKKVNYQCQIKNETKFRLDKVTFNKTGEISVEANTTSNEFVIGNKEGFFLVGLISIGVDKYSDSISSFDHNSGAVFRHEDLSKTETNKLVVRLKTNPSFPNDIFEITR